MLPFVDQTKYMEESVWLVIIFLYRTMLRKSHIFSGEFDDNLLMRSELEFCDWGLLVKVNRSKTIQYKEQEERLFCQISCDTRCSYIVKTMPWSIRTG